MILTTDDLKDLTVTMDVREYLGLSPATTEPTGSGEESDDSDEEEDPMVLLAKHMQAGNTSSGSDIDVDDKNDNDADETLINEAVYSFFNQKVNPEGIIRAQLLRKGLTAHKIDLERVKM